MLSRVYTWAIAPHEHAALAERATRWAPHEPSATVLDPVRPEQGAQARKGRSGIGNESYIKKGTAHHC